MARGRSRSLITLLFAAVFGIAAAGLSIYALQLARPTEAAVVETVSVLVPRETIPQRTLLRAEMLTQITVPVDVRHPQAVTSLGQAVGKVSKQNLVAGEQLLASKLSSQKEESGLALVIPADQRAVSVEVSEITGSGGLILPGDRVDVLAVCTTRIEANTSGRDGEDETVSENAGADSDVPQHAGGDLSRVATPLQNVVVLAVAQTINGSAPQNEDEDGDAGGRPGRRSNVGSARKAVRSTARPTACRRPHDLGPRPSGTLLRHRRRGSDPMIDRIALASKE